LRPPDLREADLRDADLRVVFRAVLRLADFLAVFFPADLRPAVLPVVFRTEVFLAGVFRVEVFLAGDFRAADLREVRFAAALFLVTDLRLARLLPDCVALAITSSICRRSPSAVTLEFMNGFHGSPVPWRLPPTRRFDGQVSAKLCKTSRISPGIIAPWAS
jgi:hypothetical protein